MKEGSWERYQANMSTVGSLVWVFVLCEKATAVRYHSSLAVTSVVVFLFSTLFVEASASPVTQIQSVDSAEDTFWASEYLFRDKRQNPITELDAFLGEWKEIKKENFDEFATAIGLTEEQRHIFATHWAVLSYTRHGTNWTVRMGYIAPNWSQTSNFKFGQPYTTVSLNGTPMSCLPIQNGQTMFESCDVATPQAYTMTILKSVNGNQMTCTLTVGRKSMRLILERTSV